MVLSNDRVALIVAADEPALYFASIDSAENYLEAIDVAAGVYGAAYGPAGEVYDLGVRDGRVIIRLNSDESPRPGALRRLLLSAVPNQGDARDDDPLSTLVERCADCITK